MKADMKAEPTVADATHPAALPSRRPMNRFTAAPASGRAGINHA